MYWPPTPSVTRATSASNLLHSVAKKLGAIDEEGRHCAEKFAEQGVGFGGQGRLVERAGHELHPAIAGGLIDWEWEVAHAQAGMATLFDVTGRSAEAADQKIAQANFCSGQIVGRVHGA